MNSLPTALPDPDLFTAKKQKPSVLQDITSAAQTALPVRTEHIPQDLTSLPAKAVQL